MIFPSAGIGLAVVKTRLCACVVVATRFSGMISAPVKAPAVMVSAVTARSLEMVTGVLWLSRTSML